MQPTHPFSYHFLLVLFRFCAHVYKLHIISIRIVQISSYLQYSRKYNIRKEDFIRNILVKFKDVNSEIKRRDFQIIYDK